MPYRVAPSKCDTLTMPVAMGHWGHWGMSGQIVAAGGIDALVRLLERSARQAQHQQAGCGEGGRGEGEGGLGLWQDGGATAILNRQVCQLLAHVLAAAPPTSFITDTSASQGTQGVDAILAAMIANPEDAEVAACALPCIRPLPPTAPDSRLY